MWFIKKEILYINRYSISTKATRVCTKCSQYVFITGVFLCLPKAVLLHNATRALCNKGKLRDLITGFNCKIPCMKKAQAMVHDTTTKVRTTSPLHHRRECWCHFYKEIHLKVIAMTIMQSLVIVKQYELFNFFSFIFV